MTPYDKLRPCTEVESCECASVMGLLLVSILAPNPIHCAECRKEIDPERLGLILLEVEELARCFGVYEALYRLWLDSGEYETYAKEKLLDPRGEVNVEAMRVAREYNIRWPTYYWMFRDVDDGEPTLCPSCGQPLDLRVKWGWRNCDACRVLV